MLSCVLFLQRCAARIVHGVSQTDQENVTTINVMTVTPTTMKRRLVTVRDLIIQFVYGKNGCLFHNVPIYKMNVLQKTS